MCFDLAAGKCERFEMARRKRDRLKELGRFPMRRKRAAIVPDDVNKNVFICEETVCRKVVTRRLDANMRSPLMTQRGAICVGDATG